MAEAQVYNQEGKKVEKIELNSNIFGVEVNEDLMHEALTAAMAQNRKAFAHTKERGEIRGGGRKPWRQKGTGRARHGSIRSPLWIGGGVTFGPRNERVFEKGINKKAKRKAMLMVLSARANDEDVMILDDLKIDNAKTKILVDLFKKLPGIERRVLFVMDKPTEEAMRAARNIDWLRIVGANNLNIVELLNYPKLVILKKALPEIEKLYAMK